ncbi:uncharacterized protein I206_103943 [Kwoniella pini CBS 10737]|uniref:Uncharacterized protein n=1 Tax=Kwoniella pini CBS 10737 TaxID=1296096 RepID=A0A1B9I333_9TREE|nr:uncharacterized protein I206_04484 [Kwoniella pini CBS 10737]OCF49953.1 hypothetical protein I206_04484 [Kwoniella pini CBS 10737]
MSRSTPKSSYQPDPNGWINTAPSSSSNLSTKRKLTQRPLVSFNHGIATPLSSGYKKSSTPRNAQSGPGPTSTANLRKRLYDQTPTIKSKQGNLNSFLHTPSSTGLLKYKGKTKEQNNESRLPLSQIDSPIPSTGTADGLVFENLNYKSGLGRGSRLKVYRDDFWGSSDNEYEPDLAQEAGRTIDRHRKEKGWMTENRNKDEEQNNDEMRKHQEGNIQVEGHNEVSPGGRGNSQHEMSTTKLLLTAIPKSLPPPAQSTRSHDRTLPAPAVATHPPPTRSHHNSIAAQGSSSLPELTPSLSPEPETEPTQPREKSSSPNMFDRLPDKTPSRPLEIYTSPPPPITPVPEYVLYNHRQMNHRNPSQFAAIPSPWRRQQRPEENEPNGGEPLVAEQSKPGNAKSNKDVSKRDDVDRRVWTAAHENRYKSPVAVEKRLEKKLVELSSSDPPSELAVEIEDDPIVKVPSIVDPVHTPVRRSKMNAKRESRQALTPLKPNQAGNPIKASSTLKKPLRRSPLTPRKRAKRSVVTSLPRTSVVRGERERSISPSPVKTMSRPFLRLSGKSPSPDHQIPSLPTTPRKAAAEKYHQITPPKSTRPAMAERQETLFILPDPPCQPLFPPKSPPQKGYRSWRPAEMEPETLLDWGLEPEGAEDAIADIQKSPQQEGSQSPEPPLFSPAGSPVREERRPSLGQRWSSKSIEPTAMSQDFPRLFPSSPSENDRSLPPSSPPLNRIAPKVNDGLTPRSASKSKWNHLQRGILASAPSTSLPRDTHSPKIKTSQKKGKSRATDEREQSQLAAFGFFGDRRSKKLKRDFAKKWEDEEDVDVPEDEYALQGETSQDAEVLSAKEGREMSRVPEAPYHPALRPAGVREMERRKERERHKAQDVMNISGMKRKASPAPELEEPPLFDSGMDSSLNISHTSSSQTSSSRTPGSTKDWWDRLGDRRASEFVTME